jgi:6-phosphofructokinase 1
MGCYTEDGWERLSLDGIKILQYVGGTTLGSSRGGFDGKKIMDSVLEKGINQLYVIGGDGTHRGIL